MQNKFDFEKADIKVVEATDTYGKFVMTPLERGYGQTLGNSLRRIMLSSLRGYAVSKVQIDGVVHEYSSIPDVKEDVTEIVMNLKELAIRESGSVSVDEEVFAYVNDGYDETVVARIEVDAKHTKAGDGVVTAADIEGLRNLEVVNKDLVIAHLSGSGTLNMELTITNGRGYVGADRSKQEKNIGEILVDAIYTPIKRVNIAVEDTRVGQTTDFDKLTIEVTTDGTTKPTEAVALAAKVMSAHLSLFVDLSDVAKNAEVMVEKAVESEEKSQDILVDDLELSQRSLNCLKRHGTNYLSQLCDMTENEVKHIRNLGAKSFEEIRDKIVSLGRSFSNGEN